ncbi:hypothetical protein BDR26DRAFT_848489 [Obelidium mucronatum]|nr:hypothetical protein BDR26DRAFT_848489 [Obelidium mucronatum]
MTSKADSPAFQLMEERLSKLMVDFAISQQLQKDQFQEHEKKIDQSQHLSQAFHQSQAKVALLEQKVNLLEEDLSQSQATVALLEQKVNLLEEDLSQSQATVALLEQKVNLLEENLSKSEAKVALLEENLSKSEAKVALLEKDLSQSQAKVAFLEQILDKSQATICLLEEKLKISQSEVLKLEGNVLNLTNTMLGQDYLIKNLSTRLIKTEILVKTKSELLEEELDTAATLKTMLFHKAKSAGNLARELDNAEDVIRHLEGVVHYQTVHADEKSAEMHVKEVVHDGVRGELTASLNRSSHYNTKYHLAMVSQCIMVHKLTAVSQSLLCTMQVVQRALNSGMGLSSGESLWCDLHQQWSFVQSMLVSFQ